MTTLAYGNGLEIQLQRELYDSRRIVRIVTLNFPTEGLVSVVFGFAGFAFLKRLKEDQPIWKMPGGSPICDSRPAAG